MILLYMFMLPCLTITLRKEGRRLQDTPGLPQTHPAREHSPPTEPGGLTPLLILLPPLKNLCTRYDVILCLCSLNLCYNIFSVCCFMKILVPVDGSEDAYNALRSACRLSMRMGYSVVAFHVDRSELYTPEFSRWHTVKRRIETEFDMLARDVIKRSYGIGGEFGVAMEVVLSHGEPADEIITYACENGVIKLITMRHGGLNGAADKRIDDETKAVILQQSKPVLVSSAPVEISSILVVIESVYDTGGSHVSVVRYTGVLARSLRARVGLICMLPDLTAIAVNYGHIGEVPYIKNRKSFRRFEEIYRQRTQAVISEARQFIADIDDSIPVEAMQTDEQDELITEVHNYDLIAICPKQKDIHTTLTDTSKTLLNNRSLNTLFVQ
ncbi:UspA domain protein [Candidatus Magnetobacterium bavaricum]|uniref:UspA domain protein n=1 Tax=Candidatus Magnetobacterium bavaricum TaxID=29290 RepID=A0A0F3GSV5_9BACT|nr:UspA domain protein [Candidatus Magnetobacterium bavaricum]